MVRLAALLAGSWNDSWPAAPRLPRLWHPDIKYFNVKHTTKPCKRSFTIATQALSLRRRKRIREAYMYKCIIQVLGYVCVGGWVVLELQEATWCSAALVGVEQQPAGGAILTRETRAHGSLASDAKCLSLRSVNGQPPRGNEANNPKEGNRRGDASLCRESLGPFSNLSSRV